MRSAAYETGAPLPEEAAPRPEFPCGVPTCYEEQVVVEKDVKWTVVECLVHGCYTRWETVKRVLGEQQIIRVQDKWHQHGTKGRAR